jgi:hypothetical protein
MPGRCRNLRPPGHDELATPTNLADAEYIFKVVFVVALEA